MRRPRRFPGSASSDQRPVVTHAFTRHARLTWKRGDARGNRQSASPSLRDKSNLFRGKYSFMSSIALVGDSYIRRLRDFLCDTSQDLDFPTTRIRFLCEGGSSLFGKKPIQPLLDQALASDLSLLLLNVGSNDVGSSPSEKIITALLSLARYSLCASRQCIVIVCQLHHRSRPPPHFSEFNDTISAINASLQDTIRSQAHPRIRFARLRGLFKPSASYYCDGVHYADVGSQLFLRGVRSALHGAARVAPNFGTGIVYPHSGYGRLPRQLYFFLASAACMLRLFH